MSNPAIAKKAQQRDERRYNKTTGAKRKVAGDRRESQIRQKNPRKTKRKRRGGGTR